MYCTDDTYQWFHDAIKKGVYRRDLTLKDWAHEIEWRLRYKDMISNGQKSYMQNEWISFKESLNNPSGRIFSEFRFASKIDQVIKTIKFPDNNYLAYEKYNVPETISQEEGLVVPMFVNISYSDKELLAAFKKQIEKMKKSSSPELKKGVNRGEKGIRPLIEDDVTGWNKFHVLECIDYTLWLDMTGEYANYECGGDEGFAKILGIKSHTLRQTSLVKARYILSRAVLGRIRASLHGS